MGAIEQKENKMSNAAGSGKDALSPSVFAPAAAAWPRNEREGIA
jgi:hypothetical protein